MRGVVNEQLLNEHKQYIGVNILNDNLVHILYRI